MIAFRNRQKKSIARSTALCESLELKRAIHFGRVYGKSTQYCYFIIHAEVDYILCFDFDLVRGRRRSVYVIKSKFRFELYRTFKSFFPRLCFSPDHSMIIIWEIFQLRLS